ncbi:3-oxo-5-alpha-steroid 4-dehydrogenase [Seminavis robusta]|uniref:3-oxo-5-alpha-steroid 4-dehydrogenase n=1 Tax=Seminavis robusta TaxID=568900 RepID=A0A9N8EW32_9STRA|nr:3-oxo-5-alpha-steroid 4-dehydrogenase [Seminavis robusta]|eukprot:Sro2437_g327640.1 3-oxo-5-alpha-steroid 4-dehydrogenase (381) ;mRNA; f:5406-6644
MSSSSTNSNSNIQSVFFNLKKLHRLIEPGAKLHPLEYPILYSLGIWFVTVQGPWGDALRQVALLNATRQVMLFIPVVQLPALLTGHMSYVDIGWPAGLVLLSLNVAYHADGGSDTRIRLLSGVLFLHGLRMFLGALHMLYPYRWPKEFFSRYQYAKDRWISQTGGAAGWTLKQQHDTLLQAYANSVPLAAPVFLAATNPRTTVHPLEVLGAMGWLVSWCMENWADVSKKMWELEANKKGNEHYKDIVLGFQPPHNQGKYVLWGLSRHPNYFFEWTCWLSIVGMAIPSAMDLMMSPEQPATAKLGVVLVLISAPRLFYDCLLYWTGAAPAESRSIQRRPNYKEYQKTTNVFFPFSMPVLNHHRTPGWPLVDDRPLLDDRKS